ncbi:MAG: Rieske 2Fe-2S domain-containing protein [Chloroflexi bacterium]|nr:Rieske 2Fe-2S domain-containing protein [Chloroflexota bacterium]
MADHIVGAVADIPPGTKRVVTVRGIEIGIFNVEGVFYALPNRCTHQWGPLCEGALSGTVRADADTGWRLQWARDGRVIVCPWHALEFDVTTGQCLAHPRVRLRRYGVRIVDEHLVLTI